MTEFDLALVSFDVLAEFSNLIIDFGLFALNFLFFSLWLRFSLFDYFLTFRCRLFASFFGCSSLSLLFFTLFLLFECFAGGFCLFSKGLSGGGFLSSFLVGLNFSLGLLTLRRGPGARLFLRLIFLFWGV